MSERVHLRIRRSSGWTDFRVEVREGGSVLEALEAAWREDHSLLFRHSCHHGSCGTCGMRINGKESLACLCRVGDVGRGERPVILEPLRNLLWVGDLVVELAPLTGAIEEVGLPVIRIADRQDGVWPAEPALGQFENCIECGLCVSACPVAGSDDRFLGPAALAAGSRVLEGAHHGPTATAMQRVAGEHGVWRCHGAFECSDVCPAEVDPAGRIFKVRGSLLRTTMREGWK